MSDAALAEEILKHSASLLSEDFLPRLRKALATLTDDRIWWRPNEHSNSVGNLILHLCGNVRQWIISGVGQEPDLRRRNLEFSERGPMGREELLDVLESTVAEADRLLRSFDPDRIQEKRHIQVYEVSVIQAVLHVVEHFSYHLGQIVYVTKMLEDVDLGFYEGL